MASMAHEPDGGEFPRDWDWSLDGATADGAYTSVNQGRTVNGPRPIIVLTIDGEPRSVWVFWEALRSKLAEELQRRKARTFTAGERISITKHPKRKSKTSDNETVPFTVRFLDVEPESALDILGGFTPAASSEPELVPDPSPAAGDHDDVVPF